MWTSLSITDVSRGAEGFQFPSRCGSAPAGSEPLMVGGLLPRRGGSFHPPAPPPLSPWERLSRPSPQPGPPAHSAGLPARLRGPCSPPEPSEGESGLHSQPPGGWGQVAWGGGTEPRRQGHPYLMASGQTSPRSPWGVPRPGPGTWQVLKACSRFWQVSSLRLGAGRGYKRARLASKTSGTSCPGLSHGNSAWSGPPLPWSQGPGD